MYNFFFFLFCVLHLYKSSPVSFECTQQNRIFLSRGHPPHATTKPDPLLPRATLPERPQHCRALPDDARLPVILAQLPRYPLPLHLRPRLGFLLNADVRPLFRPPGPSPSTAGRRRHPPEGLQDIRRAPTPFFLLNTSTLLFFDLNQRWASTKHRRPTNDSRLSSTMDRCRRHSSTSTVVISKQQ